MNLFFKRAVIAAAACAFALAARAQVLRVEITSPINEGAIAYNPGALSAAGTATLSYGVGSVAVTAQGTGYTTAPLVTFTGGGGSGATATATLTGGQVTSIDVTSPGTGYTSAPTVVLTGGGGGTGAAATATLSTAGSVSGITFSSPGAGYTSPPTISFSGGGGTGATATATIANGSIDTVTISGGSGYTSAPTVVISQPDGIVTVAARITGTDSEYTTTFFVDGKAVTKAILTAQGVQPFGTWNPPQPGSYFITAQTVDTLGNSAVSQPIRIFVPGAKIFAPIANTLVPLGSSVVISADGLTANGTATTPTTEGGLVKQIEFFVNGSSVGIDTTAPYTATYTPPTLGDYSITAVATDNYGNSVTAAGVPVRAVNAIGSAPTAKIVNPIDNSSVAAGAQVNIIADAADADGFVSKVDFYLNGVLLNTDTTFPFTATWTPAVAGRYLLVALVYDDKGNVTSSAPATITVTAGLPTVQLTSPSASGTTVAQGTKLTVAVTAAGSDGGISSLRSVEFLVDGAVNDSLPKATPGSDAAPVLSPPFVFTWQSNVALGVHRLSARVTDTNGLTITSPEIPVTVVANQLPQVSVTSPGVNATFSSNSTVTLTANASDPDGSVESVEFFVNGVSLGAPITTPPFQMTWRPTAAGPYTITAKVTDNAGATVTSTNIGVTVEPGQSPTVSVSAPRDGAVVQVGTGTSLSANASDADGTISSVQFFANGAPVGGAVTTAPFRVTWTPNAEGIYRLTATAIDNAGQSTTSNAATVLAVLSNAAGSDAVTTGNYQGGAETGQFTAINAGGKSATIVASSTVPAGKVYVFSGLAVDGSGRFSGRDPVSGATISGSFTDTGVSAQLDNGRAVLIGIDTKFGVVPSTPAPLGYYTGSIAGRPGSSLAAIVGADNSLALIVTDGTSREVGTGTLAANGTFSVTTAGGNRIEGKLDPATSLVTGTITGGSAGSFTAALTSGASFSDGFLRNLSTRGQVGTGANMLVAGFVIGGTAKKQVLIRAIGPTLANFGLTGVLADPFLEIYGGSTRLASNDNWGGDTAIATAALKVGAFPLGGASLDSALVLTLDPGAYTAQVSGVAGRTGVALVEIYDVDALSPFSAQKVMNVATRGVVGTGTAQLIAGFVISGNTGKKVLVRGVGPSLASVGLTSGTLADPVLRLVRIVNGTETLVRENDNWESGNDAALVADAGAKSGAFALSAGSRDAAILLTLPPGIYSAQLTGANSSTGIGLIEVYEVP